MSDESCVACHANANVGSVIGIMDISHSLEGAQKDISKTSQSYIIIFTVALILPFVVLLMLKVKPVLELLIMLKN